MFRDRTEAGRRLVERIGPRPDAPLVVATSRSAVPVARIVAEAYGSELDLFLVGRVRLPGADSPLGAVDEEGHFCITAGEAHAVTPSLVDFEVRRTRDVLAVHRQGCGVEAKSWAGRRVVLVDDAPATGAALLMAVRRARRQGAAEVVAAAPVATADAVARIEAEADAVVVLDHPDPPGTVTGYYEERDEVTDEQVRELLGDGGT